MIERLRGKVENITFISKIADSLDLCEIQIDFDTMKIFYNANDLMQFIGMEVLYTTRPDVVNGKMEVVVCELVALSTIQTLSSSENIKLIPEGNKRTVCNIESRNIRFGEFYPNCVALMSKYEYGSSPKAKWFDCTLIDSVSKEFQVRLFASNTDTEKVEDTLKLFVGGYVSFDLESTKYGFQTKEIVGLPNEVEASPEVTVAKDIIMKMISEDEALLEYDRKYEFINNMSSVIDGEPGYVLVRMASELYMVNAIDNISTDLDIKAMKRAIVCSRGYLLPHKTAWSRPMLNTNKLMSVGALKLDRELMLMLDVFSEEESSSTKQTYIKIRGLVNDIIKIRRGLSNEEDNTNYVNIVNNFNGLL